MGTHIRTECSQTESLDYDCTPVPRKKGRRWRRRGQRRLLEEGGAPLSFQQLMPRVYARIMCTC